MQKLIWLIAGFVLGVILTLAGLYMFNAFDQLLGRSNYSQENQDPGRQLAANNISSSDSGPKRGKPNPTNTHVAAASTNTNSHDTSTSKSGSKTDADLEPNIRQSDYVRPLPGAGYVYGLVLNASDKGVEGAQIDVFNYNTMQPLNFVQSNPLGEFEVFVGENAVVALKVTMGAYAKSVERKATPAGGEYIIRLNDPGILSGRVIAEHSGQGVNDFTIVARQLNEIGIQPDDLDRFRELPTEWHDQTSQHFKDADGYFTLDNIPAGTYALYVYPKDFGFTVFTGSSNLALRDLSRSRDGLRLQPGEIRDDLIIPVTPYPPAQGYVKDSEGKPLKDVTVSIWFGGSLGGSIYVPVPEQRSVQSESDGRFEINLGNSYNTGGLVFEKEGYVKRSAHYSQFLETKTTTDGSTTVEAKQPSPTVILDPDTNGAAVNGIIYNEQGVPQPNHTVVIKGYMGTEQNVTDKSGYYTFWALPPGKYDLYLDGGFGNIEENPEELILRAGRTVKRDYAPHKGIKINGKTIWGTSILKNVDVELYGKTNAGTRISRVVSVDNEGRYEFEHVEAGNYSLTLRQQNNSVSMSGYHFPLQVRDKDKSADLILPGTKVNGRVLDDDTSEPVKNVQIYFQMNETSNGQNMQNFQAMTNTDGEFEIIGIKPSSYRVRITARYYKPTELQSSLQINNDQQQTLDTIGIEKITPGQ